MEQALGPVYFSKFSDTERREMRPLDMWNRITQHLRAQYHATMTHVRHNLFSQNLANFDGRMDEYTDTILELQRRVNANGGAVDDADVVAVMTAGIPGGTRAGTLYFDTIQRINERIDQDNYDAAQAEAAGTPVPTRRVTPSSVQNALLRRWREIPRMERLRMTFLVHWPVPCTL